ncbi:hypothetical protein [Paracoccus aestuarii]|uniref:hypothetical protein n=1 Tax=Paracoccus aestuarii TaxID=453842 RepID=UPI002350C0D5|nr:hypothetical protein [Paracoccus aestuarii]
MRRIAHDCWSPRRLLISLAPKAVLSLAAEQQLGATTWTIAPSLALCARQNIRLGYLQQVVESFSIRFSHVVCFIGRVVIEVRRDNAFNLPRDFSSIYD